MNGKKITDTLLEQCKKKENKAFKELYTLFSKAMFSISMRIVNDRNEAQDILQESFIKAFKDMSRFGTMPEFTAWLKRVVINHSLDVVRKQKDNFISIDDTDIAEEENSSEEAAFYDINTVIECIQQLPNGYRVILTLFLLENYSHKEIAGLLNVSEGTSRSQYSRARKKLIFIINQKTYNHVTH